MNTDAGSATATVLWTPPSAVSDSSAVTLTSNYYPGDTFPIGTTLVTYTALDAAGNSANKSFNVVVTGECIFGRTVYQDIHLCILLNISLIRTTRNITTVYIYLKLSELLSHYSPTRTLLLEAKSNHSWGDRSFAIAAPRIWNELPFNIYKNCNKYYSLKPSSTGAIFCNTSTERGGYHPH